MIIYIEVHDLLIEINEKIMKVAKNWQKFTKRQETKDRKTGNFLGNAKKHVQLGVFFCQLAKISTGTGSCSCKLAKYTFEIQKNGKELTYFFLFLEKNENGDLKFEFWKMCKKFFERI